MPILSMQKEHRTDVCYYLLGFSLEEKELEDKLRITKSSGKKRGATAYK